MNYLEGSSSSLALVLFRLMGYSKYFKNSSQVEEEGGDIKVQHPIEGLAFQISFRCFVPARELEVISIS